MSVLRIVIPGEPVAQGRPRAFYKPGLGVRTYDPEKSRNWKAEARAHIANAMRKAGRSDLLDGPLWCSITATFSCPRSDYSKRTPRERRPHAKRPDAENVCKAALDALTGVAIVDDSRVVALHVHKIIGAQGEAPSVVIELADYYDWPAAQRSA